MFCSDFFYFSCSVVRAVVSRAHWKLDPMLRVPAHVVVEKVDRLLWSCMREKESKKRGNTKQNAFSLKMLFSWKIFAGQSEPNGRLAFAPLWATQPRTYELIHFINVQRRVSMKNFRKNEKIRSNYNWFFFPSISFTSCIGNIEHSFIFTWLLLHCVIYAKFIIIAHCDNDYHVFFSVHFTSYDFYIKYTKRGLM